MDAPPAIEIGGGAAAAAAAAAADEDRDNVWDAAAAGDIEALDYLIHTGGTPVDARTQDGMTPFLVAAANGRVDVCEWLVGQGADVAAITKAGNCAGHFAARCDCVNLLRHLVEQLLVAPNKHKDTPLHFAAASQAVNAVKLLVQFTNINARNATETTPLMCAAANCGPQSANIMKLLLDKGADMKLVNNIGCTALHCAAQAANVPAVQLLLERGVDVTVRVSSGETAQSMTPSTPDGDKCSELINAVWQKLDDAAKAQAEILMSIMSSSAPAPAPGASASASKKTSKSARRKQRNRQAVSKPDDSSSSDEEQSDTASGGAAAAPAPAVAAPTAVASPPPLPVTPTAVTKSAPATAPAVTPKSAPAAAPATAPAPAPTSTPKATITPVAAPAPTTTPTPKAKATLRPTPESKIPDVPVLVAQQSTSAPSEAIQAALYERYPKAEYAAVKLEHFAGIDLHDLSASQLEVLEDMHMDALRRVSEAKVLQARRAEHDRILG